MKKIHINCDLGEGGGRDEQLMPLISACNIACGGHAGTVETMQHTVDLAIEHKVEIGAHPSYPDKEHFGRSTLQIAPEELKRSLVAQILSLKQITEAEGARLKHVKPHGALYNDAQKDGKIAQIIIDSILEFDDPLVLYSPENSVLARLAAGKIQLKFEAFADRKYTPEGALVSRQKKHALLTQKEEVFEQLFLMISEGKIEAENGQKIACRAETFCIHGDTPNSVEIIEYLHRRFPEKNIYIETAK